MPASAVILELTTVCESFRTMRLPEAETVGSPLPPRAVRDHDQAVCGLIVQVFLRRWWPHPPRFARPVVPHRRTEGQQGREWMLDLSVCPVGDLMRRRRSLRPFCILSRARCHCERRREDHPHGKLQRRPRNCSDQVMGFVEDPLWGSPDNSSGGPLRGGRSTERAVQLVLAKPPFERIEGESF